MRWLGVDVGRRRTGLALSDESGALARPWKAVEAGRTPDGAAQIIEGELTGFARDALDGSRVEGIVVGLPRRLGGEDTDQTSHARALAEALGRRTGLPVRFQDERLSSREAEERLARHERDWRKRKGQIDAMAAAIILQDFLDAR